MKTLIHLTASLIGLTLPSCQDSGHKTNGHPSNSHTQILHGVWIPNNYIKEIKRTSSPIEASEFLTGYSELTIDTTKIQGDSLFIGAGWNNHEGTGFYTWFKQGQTETSFPTSSPHYNDQSNLYELGYEINQADTSLILYHYNQDKKLLGKSFFTKISGVTATLSDGLSYFVNSVLITGKYELLKNGQKVEFTNDGQVIGLESFKTYYIQTDFVSLADNNIDNIIFDVYTDTSKVFAYKIKQDTLEFYTTRTDTTNMQMNINGLQYRLVRQK